MRTSGHLTEQEILRCVTDSGPIAGQHQAALERQKWAVAAAERHAALKANPAVAPAHRAKRQVSTGIQVRLSHWLGVKLISAGQRLADSAT